MLERRQRAGQRDRRRRQPREERVLRAQQREQHGSHGNNITLHVEGRDLLDMVEKAVALDKETWSILGEAAEVQGTQQRQRVLKSLRRAANGLTTAENQVLLLRMVEAGQVERVTPTRGTNPRRRLCTHELKPTTKNWGGWNGYQYHDLLAGAERTYQVRAVLAEYADYLPLTVRAAVAPTASPTNTTSVCGT
jgi:hypothetical protein